MKNLQLIHRRELKVKYKNILQTSLVSGKNSTEQKFMVSETLKYINKYIYGGAKNLKQDRIIIQNKID